jgi:putative ATP-dependent DNA ligase
MPSAPEDTVSARKRYPVAPSPERFAAAEESRATQRHDHRGVPYIRLREDFHGMPRGAILVDGRVVPDYPHIARIFALSSGVQRNFRGPFVAEEKIDGYNARIFRAGGEIMAVTRSGRVCPFTVDRLPDLLDIDALSRLFNRHPDLILCAEVAGPGNPYMSMASPHGGDDVRLFVFDLLRYGEQTFVPLAERDRILSRFELPVAPPLGQYTADDLPAVAGLVRELDARGAEGIVLKPPEQGLRVKYVCPSINVEDVITEAALEMELPGEFYTHRMVRMIMALRELDQRDRLESLGKAFGRALAGGFDEALAAVERDGELARVFRVRLRQAHSADALLDHLGRSSRTVSVREQSREWDGTHWVLTFKKIYRRSSSRLGTLLRGGPVFD